MYKTVPGDLLKMVGLDGAASRLRIELISSFRAATLRTCRSFQTSGDFEASPGRAQTSGTGSGVPELLPVAAGSPLRSRSGSVPALDAKIRARERKSFPRFRSFRREESLESWAGGRRKGVKTGRV